MGWAILGVVGLFIVLATPFAAFVALSRTSELEDEVSRLRAQIARLRTELEREPGRASAGPPESVVEAPAAAPPALAPPPLVYQPALEVEAPPVGDAPAPEPPTVDDVRIERPQEREQAAAEPRPRVPPAPAPTTAIDLETLVGSTWLLRIGLGVLAIAFALFARSVGPQLPAAAKVALAYATAIGIFAAGKVFEAKLERFARPVMAAGLTFGFFVAYASYFVPATRAVSLPVSVAWMTLGMVAVLVAAERWSSQPTAILAIALGQVSALVSAGSADMYALFMIASLAILAALLVLRHGWVGLGLFAVATSYGAHLIWLLSERAPVSGDVGFWLNLGFLTTYYVVFLTADVLWWWRESDRQEDGDAVRARTARQVGPTNLVLYASLASFVYVGTGAAVDTIEWFYLVLGTAQGALAWLYWGLRHRDFGFYPAFGTVLWTLGMFAALDALALNLVLAVQALLLLLAAHHTRLVVFHALAQASLALTFVHYLAYPTLAATGVAALLGGLGIAAVYFLKSSLEEIWFEDPDADGVFDAEVEVQQGRLWRALADALRAAAPYLAPIHATLGGFVAVREILRWSEGGWTAGLGLVAVAALLATVVVVRRRTALLFGVTAVTLAAPYLASTAADPPAVLVLLDGAVLIGLFLVASSAAGQIASDARAHGQAGVLITVFAAWVAVAVMSLTSADYLPAMTFPLLVFAFQERLGTEPGSRERTLSIVGCVLTALAIVALTASALGPVAVGPVWIAAWAALLAAVSAPRRSGQLYLSGIVLLLAGYLALLPWDPRFVEDVFGSIAVGGATVLVPLVLAIATDAAVSRHDEEAVSPAALPITYVLYGVALVLVGTLAHHQLAPGWSIAAAAALTVALALLPGALRTQRARAAGPVYLIVLHTVVFARGVDGGREALLLPLLVFCAVTLVGERVLSARRPVDGTDEAWAGVRVVLVSLAAWSSMAAIYESAELGAQWATAGWSVLGVSLMVAGFAWRSAIHRRVALLVLGACLVRVFAVDTRGLSDLERTIAFFVLGVCLVGAAWLYSRYQNELKEWL